MIQKYFLLFLNFILIESAYLKYGGWLNGKVINRNKKIMNERFGKDNIIALATVKDGVPYVRNVNGFYEDGAFYIITYALSNKMKQIEENPHVAISGDWFTAHGKGVNLGWFCKDENKNIAKKLRNAFAEWIDNGHNDFDISLQRVFCFHMVQDMI